MKNVIIFGATSTLASKTAERYASDGDSLTLVARNQSRLDELRAHLTVLGANNVKSMIHDFSHLEGIESLISEVSNGTQIDIAIIAHGTLTDQSKSEQDLHYLEQEFNVNALSVIKLCAALANTMEQQKSGTLAVFGSVAGDRGRPSNYSYGATKSAIESFCSGLRCRLFQSNVNLLLIKPGIILTAMTEDLDNLPEKLVAKPEVVANDVYEAIRKGKSVLYTPFFWQFIMLVIKFVPNFIFKKLKL